MTHCQMMKRSLLWPFMRSLPAAILRLMLNLQQRQRLKRNLVRVVGGKLVVRAKPVEVVSGNRRQNHRARQTRHPIHQTAIDAKMKKCPDHKKTKLWEPISKIAELCEKRLLFFLQQYVFAFVSSLFFFFNVFNDERRSFSKYKDFKV